jgi:hypothetical protein
VGLADDPDHIETFEWERKPRRGGRPSGDNPIDWDVIRPIYENTDAPQSVIAERFGISVKGLRDAAKRRGWQRNTGKIAGNLATAMIIEDSRPQSVKTPTKKRIAQVASKVVEVHESGELGDVVDIAEMEDQNALADAATLASIQAQIMRTDRIAGQAMIDVATVIQQLILAHLTNSETEEQALMYKRLMATKTETVSGLIRAAASVAKEGSAMLRRYASMDPNFTSPRVVQAERGDDVVTPQIAAALQESPTEALEQLRQIALLTDQIQEGKRKADAIAASKTSTPSWKPS